MERESPEDRGSERNQPGVTASGSRGQSSSVRDVDAPPCATHLRLLVRCEPYASYGYGLHRPTTTSLLQPCCRWSMTLGP
jgi:hypothetical protein